MIYLVTIEYKKGPAFGPWLVHAPDKQAAEWQAKRDAEGMGFDRPVKKVTVREK